jgi:mono/diheme cytochrome c family protein
VNWPVVIAVVLAMALLRLFKPGLTIWTLAWALGPYLCLRYGFATPVPGSVIQLYMGIVLLSIAAYVTSNRERMQETVAPLVRLAVEPGKTPLLAVALLVLPALVVANVYRERNRPLEVPAFNHTVHPAHPESISVHDRAVDLATADNPLRSLETTDPEEFLRHVAGGRDLYFRHCHYCHGTDMAGQGMFAQGLYPPPTSFVDQGTIAQQRESYLFWRIAKGGPGLPLEGAPWETSMPAWEQFLTEEQIWELILALYHDTGQRPWAVVTGVHE